MVRLRHVVCRYYWISFTWKDIEPDEICSRYYVDLQRIERSNRMVEI